MAEVPRRGAAAWLARLGRSPGLIGAVTVIALWLLLARTGLVGRTLLADPGEVLRVFARALDPAATGRDRILVHAGGTLGRALCGWLLAVGLGVLGGVGVGARRFLHRGSEPVVDFARAIPPIMVFPLFLVAFNYGDSAYVGTIAFGCVPVVMLTVGRAMSHVSPAKMEVLQVFGAPRRVRAFAAVMEVVPSCFLGARIALSLSLVIAVVTEMVFTPRSGLALGSLAKDAQMSFDTPVVYAALLIVGVFGFAANALMRVLEARLGVDAGERL